MTSDTATACCSSHSRQAAPAKLIRLQHRDPATRLAYETESDKAVESAIHVLAAGADHAGERSLAEWNVDQDTATYTVALALSELDQFKAHTGRNVEARRFCNSGGFETDVARVAG